MILTILCSFLIDSIPPKSNPTNGLTIDVTGWEIVPNTQYGTDFGYKPSGRHDTTKAIILVTECDSCQSRSTLGFAVRQLQVYHGDRMPPGNYSDWWDVTAILNGNKKPFPSNTIIWNYKIKQ